MGCRFLCAYTIPLPDEIRGLVGHSTTLLFSPIMAGMGVYPLFAGIDDLIGRTILIFLGIGLFRYAYYYWGLTVKYWG